MKFEDASDFAWWILRNDFSMAAPGRFQLLAKRAFDIAASALVLIVLLPLTALVLLAIKLESRGPVFSVTYRHCYGNRSIPVLKFRCTRRRSITFIGNVLILGGLDKLPMFVNVLRGDMSVVGLHHFVALPLVHLAGTLSSALRESPFRAGLISSEGPYHRLNSERRDIEADIFYIFNWSLLLDAKIIFAMLFAKTSYVRRHHAQRRGNGRFIR